MNRTRIDRRAEELGVQVRITQDSTRYGEFTIEAPLWYCFGCNSDHTFWAGWGEGQTSCNRQECYEDIMERLSHGVSLCGCECCCDIAKQTYDLADDTPDCVVMDYARDCGDLPVDFAEQN